jgi:excisionase family DNA binding protein
MNSKLLTVEEFAAYLGWQPSTVRQKVWRREIDYVKIGRSVRFKAETAEKLIERGTVPALEQG